VVQVVGESYCRDALERITGSRTPEGCNLTEVATLVAEPTNPYDANAIAVYIRGLKVGYLSREDAVAFKPVVDGLLRGRKVGTCPAAIRDGWYRSESGCGDFGVTLQLAPAGQALAGPYSGPGALRGRHHSEWEPRVWELKRTDPTAAEALLRELIEAAEQEVKATSHCVGHIYYELLAIVLRKQKRYAEEIAVLERFARLCGAGNPLAGRLDKVRALAARESAKGPSER